MARFVTFPGTAGSYASTDDVNLLDADSAHCFQAMPWVSFQNADTFSQYVESAAFAGFGTQFQANGGANPSSRAVDVAVSGSDVVSGRVTVPATPGFDCRISVQFRNGGALTTVNGAWIDVSAGSSPIVENAVADVAATLARTRVTFRMNGGGDPVNGEVFQHYNAVLVSGATAPAQFVPSLRIVGDLDLRADVAAADWTPAGPQRLIQKSSASVDGFRVTIAPTSVGANYGDGATDRFTSTTQLVVVDGQRTAIRVTYDVSTGDTVWYQDNVQIDTGSVTTGAGTYVDIEARIGQNHATGENFDGDMYSAEIRDGIDGPIVAVFDPDDITI